MKIVICGSMSAAQQMLEAEKDLTQNGHEVILPKNTEQYAKKILARETAHESTQHKIEHDLIRGYFDKIKNADVILVVNTKKGNIQNYIGGNSFLEMGFAHVLNKKIYLLNPYPEMIYTDEIIAMQPIIINGDLSKLNS